MKRPPGRPPITASRDQVLAIIRDMEQDSLKNMPNPPDGITHAYGFLPITRELYAVIERPPTRHHMFYIRTIWRHDGWVAERHSVFVKDRHGSRPVVYERPGAFGA